MAETVAKTGMAPPHPGRFIHDEVLEQLGLSVDEAATALQVEPAALSDVVSGRAALTAEMAMRIEKALDVNMDVLLRMQAWHDAHAMRARATEIKVGRFQPTPVDPR